MNYWHVWTPRGHDKARGEWVTPRLENKGSRERVQNINYAHIPFNNSYNAMKTIARVLGTRSTRTVSGGPLRMMEPEETQRGSGGGPQEPARKHT